MKLNVLDRPAFAYTGGKVPDARRDWVVFIHGAMNDHSVWALQSRAIAHRGYNVLAVDLPGHGQSEGPAAPDVEAAADWVVAFLGAVHARSAAIVGHSMGSLIALEAAARLGSQASHLVMVGTAYPMQVSPALLAMAEHEPLKAIDMVNALSHATLSAKPSAPAPGFWLQGANRALMRRLQAVYAQAGHGNLFLHDFRVCDAYRGAESAIARVRCPARLILGAKDQMTSTRHTAMLAQALHADTLTLAAGHSLMGETPDAVLNGILTHLARSPS